MYKYKNYSPILNVSKDKKIDKKDDDVYQNKKRKRDDHAVNPDDFLDEFDIKIVK